MSPRGVFSRRGPNSKIDQGLDKIAVKGPTARLNRMNWRFIVTPSAC